MNDRNSYLRPRPGTDNVPSKLPTGRSPDAPPGQFATKAPSVMDSRHTSIGASRGMNEWLQRHDTSFAFGSYQTGRLMMVGSGADGRTSIHQQDFGRVMGLAWDGRRLHLAGAQYIFSLANVLAPGTLADGGFDAKFVARDAHASGYIDVHEMAIDSSGKLIFVNTAFSCLATVDDTYAFRPIWKPTFISKLAPEDRCHMNGLGMKDGKPKFVTAVSTTDTPDGWHGRPLPKGVIIDVETDKVVSDELAMPHSPRWWNGQIYALDSGRGFLVQVDPQTGKLTDVAFLPGFSRGMAIVGDYALVTVSKPRYDGFKDLPIEDEMNLRQGTPMCAVLVIDLRDGDIVEYVKLEGYVTELFAVELLPGIKCPMSVGPGTPEFEHDMSFVDIVD